MEIVKCIKIIVPGLRTKSAKKHIVAHIIRKTIAGASAFGSVAFQILAYAYLTPR